jgi:predicted nucleic acid-binding protein
MQTVYLETSVVSYCASRQSRDIIIAARQQETRDWWHKYSQKYEIFISQQVVDEASDGDQEAAADRLRVIEGLTLLELTDDSLVLAEHLVLTNAIPSEYPEDAVHIAVAAVHGMDYLLTWNFKHINNATRKGTIERQVRYLGYECPIICTPEELTLEP